MTDTEVRLGTGRWLSSMPESFTVPRMGTQIKEYFTEAIRYWEPRRILYNAVLATVALFYFYRAYPLSWRRLDLDAVLMLFVLAVGANMVYCAAYLPDLFAQASSFRDLWRRYRWVLFVIGVTLGAILSRWIAKSLIAGYTF